MKGRKLSFVVDDLHAESKANAPSYVAEVANAERRILVTIIPPNSTVRFCRSFHSICDAEHWLSRLARTGLSARDRTRIPENELRAFDVDGLGSIRIVDHRQSKRCLLPEVFV